MGFRVFFIPTINNFNNIKSVSTVFITVFLRVMENAAVIQLEILTKRLNEAERRAKLLKLEVKSIQKEITALQQTVIRTPLNGNTSSSLQTRAYTTVRDDFSLDQPSTSSVDGPSTSNKRLRDDSSILPIKKAKGTFNKENDYVVVYTDGACENNGRPNAKAGIGVWFGEGHPLNISKPVVGKPTNNTAEIQACVQALHTIKDNGEDKVKIITDSEFTINCMTKWIKNWKKNNWKTASGGSVKNKEDLQKLDTVIKTFADVQWEHVAGHCGIKGNEEADKLARQGALQYRHRPS